MAFTKVAAGQDVPEGEMLKFDVGDLEITVTNVKGSFYAFEDRCPHMNSPLHQGKLEVRLVFAHWMRTDRCSVALEVSARLIGQ